VADADASTSGFAEFSSKWGRVFSFSWRILQPDDEWIVELILSMFKLAGCLLWLLLWIAILWS
jgi:hypothetical protein